mmetsp:Transcript_44573/g.105644  ORF Transcript_44573/g.105644 Transcript_44573/m.105644 type:complete len:750 (-) Transcript_44573:99-2348(-)
MTSDQSAAEPSAVTAAVAEEPAEAVVTDDYSVGEEANAAAGETASLPAEAPSEAQHGESPGEPDDSGSLPPPQLPAAVESQVIEEQRPMELESPPDRVEQAGSQADAPMDSAAPEEEVSAAATDSGMPKPAENGAKDVEPTPKAKAKPKPSESVEAPPVPEEGGVDDIVPTVSYDHTASRFSKEERMILPKTKSFPKIFCGLRVILRIESLLPSEKDFDLSRKEVDAFLQEEHSLSSALIHWEDSRSGSDDKSAKEVLLALESLPSPGFGVGNQIQADDLNLFGTVTDVVDTEDDFEASRISELAQCLREAGNSDAILLELPQLWIIPDEEFKCKSGSIGLYPGSYWMGFFKSWGAISTADVFFRTVHQQASEKKVHLLVKFAEREALKLSFTFLYKRFLAHPHKDQGYRDPSCRLVVHSEFLAKANPKAGGIAKAKSSAQPRADGSGVVRKPAKAAGKAAGAHPPVAKMRPSQLAPPTPMPKAASAEMPSRAPANVPKAASSDDPGRPLTPAEAMQGMTARQREVFEMVVARMERLESENQELMQILLQLNTLLQDSQQRNSRLAQVAAGYKGMADGMGLPAAVTQAQGLLAQAGASACSGRLPAGAAQAAPAPQVPQLTAVKTQAVLSEGAMLLQQHRQQLQKAQEVAVASASTASCPQAMGSSGLPVSRVNPAPLGNAASASSGEAAKGSISEAAKAVTSLRAEKRKKPAELEPAGASGADAPAEGEDGLQAPWKSQRRYQRRPRA